MTTSFRDPAGRLFLFKDRALRLVSREAASNLLDFLATDVARDLTAAGHLIKTKQLDKTAYPVLFQITETDRFG